MRGVGFVIGVAALTLTGCASCDDAGAPSGDNGSTRGAQSSAPGPSESAHSTATPTSRPDVVQVAVRNGQVIPATHRVNITQGHDVRLVVTSDQADEPGKPAVINLTADEPGLYEVETHESGLQLLQLLVR